ncbi:MAG: hypothetical protein ACXWGY_00460, partial [Chthoniobacterales bacterium]
PTPPDHATFGGTPLGLVLGTIALAIFVFAALLGVRKKLPFLPVGNVQRWLRGHIWLTLLTIPLILLHSGFHLGGPMTTLLMGLYAVVMLSGIYGLILQHKLPTLMKERLPAEIVYEQIPNVRAQLCAAAEKLQRSLKQETETPLAVPAALMPDVSKYAVLKTPSAAEKGTSVATVSGTQINPAAFTDPNAREASAVDATTDEASETVLATFIERRLLPYLQAQRGEKYRLGHPREAAEIFRHLKLRVGAAYRVRVEEMQGWCDERRLLDMQTRMQHWMHAWLFVHVPFSFLLLLMTVWHAFVTLFRY